MKELSVFVDESGDFGEFEKHAPYYIITMVLHDQSVDISEQIWKLNETLKNMGYGNEQASDIFRALIILFCIMIMGNMN